MNDKRSKRIIVHLGPPKTGTTTIQAFLYRARGALLESGLRYSDAGRIRRGQTLTVERPGGTKRISGPATAQHLLPWSLLGEVDELPADEVWRAFVAEIDECPQHTMLVSSEAFSRLRREHVEYVHERLAPHAVTPVAYVRKPLSRMLSDYTQRVKGGRCDTTFSEFLNDERHLLDNYDGFIDIWDSVFGHDAVVIRSFDAAVAGDGLEKDFADFFTSNCQSLRDFQTSGRLNVSPGNQAIRTQRGINRVERLLGRPALLRRLFAAARKFVVLRGPAALQRKLGSDTALQTRADTDFIESLSAERYECLLSRCHTIHAPRSGIAENTHVQ